MHTMQKGSVWEVFRAFLVLGCTSFGGPVAHLGYFRAAFVEQRRWLTEQDYADLVSLCQFMPGPASSQVGLCLGYARAGYTGAFAAWLGFTLPSAILLILFALGMGHVGIFTDNGLLQGLKIVAVAVVAQAVWGMGKQLCPDRQRLTLMAIAAACVLLVPAVAMQMLVIVVAGTAGFLLYRRHEEPVAASRPLAVTESVSRAGVFLVLFFVLLFGLPVLATLMSAEVAQVFDAFYRAGALVFGGGHVVLPLLQAEVVTPGWVDASTFLAGYGVAQAVPGPLFTFSAFLGAVLSTEMSGWGGGLFCLVAIFLPSFLLVFGVLPFWQRIRAVAGAQAALKGINAGVVGLLLAALYQPVWVAGIVSAPHFVLAVMAFLALSVWRLPPWLVVLGGGLLGWAFSLS